VNDSRFRVVSGENVFKTNSAFDFKKVSRNVSIMVLDELILGEQKIVIQIVIVIIKVDEVLTRDTANINFIHENSEV